MFDPKKPQPPPPIPVNTSKTTSFVLLGGNHHFLPPVPDGPHTGPMALPTRSNTTPLATKSGQNEERDKGKRPPGVLDQNGRPRSETLRIAVEQDGKWFKYHLPNPPMTQNPPPPFLVPKTMCFASSGGKSPNRPSVTAQQLESSHHTCNKCHAPRNRTYGATALKSNPPKWTKHTLTRFWPMFLMEKEGKWVVAGAQHHPSCFEGERESRNNANCIKKE